MSHNDLNPLDVTKRSLVGAAKPNLTILSLSLTHSPAFQLHNHLISSNDSHSFSDRARELGEKVGYAEVAITINLTITHRTSLPLSLSLYPANYRK